MKNEKNQTYLDEAENLLNGKGLEFTGDRKGRISLRWDWEIGHIQKARISRNPKTGEKVDTPEKKTIHFKFGKELFD